MNHVIANPIKPRRKRSSDAHRVLACDMCYRKHQRCSGNYPCQRCRKMGIQCRRRNIGGGRRRQDKALPREMECLSTSDVTVDEEVAGILLMLLESETPQYPTWNGMFV